MYINIGKESNSKSVHLKDRLKIVQKVTQKSRKSVLTESYIRSISTTCIDGYHTMIRYKFYSLVFFIAFAFKKPIINKSK